MTTTNQVEKEEITPFTGKTNPSKTSTTAKSEKSATAETPLENKARAPEKIVRKGAISVRPFFDPTRKNMGLEKYGMVLFDGVSQAEQLTCLEANGVRRYITGLNEFAPEVRMIRDDEKRMAVIKEIRRKVIFLEKVLGSNVLDENDPKFWENVKTVSPTNYDFWGKVDIVVANDVLFLDPEDPMGLIKITAIEAGGFDIIAKSLEDAKNRPNPPKFYLDKIEETASTKIEITVLRNKALGILGELYNTNANKLLYIAKILDGNSAQYKKNTPNDIIYFNMDNYINANGVEGSRKKAPQYFLDLVNTSMEDLILKALIRDASFYKYIINKGDGMIYHAKSAVMMGRNPSDCFEFLKNSQNEKTLDELQAEVEKMFIE